MGSGKRSDKLERLGTTNEEDLKFALEVVRTLMSQTSELSLNGNDFGNAREITVKMENETPSGSFKMRGASYYLKSLMKEAGSKNIPLFTASTGNQGISLARVAKELGQSLTIVLPNGAPLEKQQKILELGARLFQDGQVLDEALMIARELAISQNGHFINSTDAMMILGHSTIGVELFMKFKDLDYIFFPMGMGSGISGLCLARNIFSKNTKIVGVVPENCPAWIRSFEAGSPVCRVPEGTLADGLKIAKPDAELFRFLGQNLNNLISVSEIEIKASIDFAKDKLAVEPEGAGAVGLAGLKKYALQGKLIGKHAATVICGGKKT